MKASIIFLIDEIEAHLHPQWQRRIVPALLDVMNSLTGDHLVNVQLITATHSPMVLASIETHFEPDSDAIWELDLVDGSVILERSHWRRHGDANAWLTSTVFDLKFPRSIEAENALIKAKELLLEEAPSQADVRTVDRLLRDSLSDTESFWLRWEAYRNDLLEDK